MRVAAAAALAFAILAPVPVLAAADSPEATAGVEAVKGHMRVQKNVNFRRLKATPSGDVCGAVSAGADRDIEFLWTKATGVVWVAEDDVTANSLFNYGAPSVRRSTEREDLRA